MILRMYAISMMILISLQSAIGAHGASGMLCMGGADQHAVKQVCASHCEHDDSPMPSHSHEHGDECGCVDIAITFADLRLQSRDEIGSVYGVMSMPMDDWRSMALDTSYYATGPPIDTGPDWARAESLYIVRTTCLQI